jgi:hypothetical protein
MPINKYSCKKCGFEEEYVESISVSKECLHPENCPKCNEGKLEKIEDWTNSHGGFDIIGSCYMNDHGKHAWKKKMNMDERVKVLTGEKTPY